MTQDRRPGARFRVRARVIGVLLALSLAVGAGAYLVSGAYANTGPGPWQTEPNCVQPPAQSVKDHATFTQAELKLYGMPEREPGESFDHWAKIVRSMNHRICQYRSLPGVYHGMRAP